MNRKSEQIQNIHLQHIRKPKKNKTFSKDQSEFKIKGPKHMISESIAASIYVDLIQNVQNKLNEKREQLLLRTLMGKCHRLVKTLKNLNDPQNQEIDSIPLPEQEPQKNRKDPISGFDRNISIKNQMTKRGEESILSDLKVTPSEMNLNLLKKGWKGTNKDSRSKSSAKLIPLKTSSNSIMTQEKKLQDFYRQKLLKEINSNKVSMKIIDTANNRDAMKGDQIKYVNPLRKVNFKAKQNTLRTLFKFQGENVKKMNKSQTHSIQKQSSLISHFSKIGQSQKSKFIMKKMNETSHQAKHPIKKLIAR